MTALAPRLMPHDLDAEAAVLSAVLLAAKTVLAEVRDILSVAKVGLRVLGGELGGNVYRRLRWTVGDGEPELAVMPSGTLEFNA